MIPLIVIVIILIFGFSLEKLRANRTKKDKFTISVTSSFACFAGAIFILIFAFYIFIDFTSVLVIALIFSGILIWAGFYNINQERKLREYEEKFGNKSKTEDDK